MHLPPGPGNQPGSATPCHTSHQATLTSNTPRPGNQGFIMSPMSPHVTMSHHAPVPAWQCHTMSHQATLTSNTPRPGNQGFIMSPMSPPMSHHAHVTPCTCASFIMSPMSPHVTMSHHEPVPHHVTTSHPDIVYPQTRKPRFYHVTNVTMSHHAPVPAWQCHTMSHQATLTSTTPRPGNQGFIMSPMSPHVPMSHHAPVPAWHHATPCHIKPP